MGIDQRFSTACFLRSQRVRKSLQQTPSSAGCKIAFAEQFEDHYVSDRLTHIKRDHGWGLHERASVSRPALLTAGDDTVEESRLVIQHCQYSERYPCGRVRKHAPSKSDEVCETLTPVADEGGSVQSLARGERITSDSTDSTKIRTGSEKAPRKQSGATILASGI